MGLDMYLHKRTYVKKWEHTPEERVYNIKIEREVGTDIDVEKISTIEEEIAYWRKANQIHSWFVNNVQEGDDDCKDYYVSLEELNELVKLCKEVLANPSKAEELLPTRSGFFFGSTEYDEYYFQDLRDTVQQIEPHLDEKIEGSFYYTSSW